MPVVGLKLLAHYDRAFPLPTYQTPGAAGADIRAMLDGQDLVIHPGERVLVPTGLAMEIPPGFEIQVRPRSGLSYKTGLMVLNTPGTIDSDYRGEVKIILGNLGQHDEIIKHGDRIAQLVLAACLQATFTEQNTLHDTERGVGGFGHTGQQ